METEIEQITNIIPFKMIFFFVLIWIWIIIWKGIALWKAAREGSKTWFIVLLIVNTLGILEIIYIFAVKPKWSLRPKKEEKKS